MMEAQDFKECVYAPDRREFEVIGSLSPHNILSVKDFAAAQGGVRSATRVEAYGKLRVDAYGEAPMARDLPTDGAPPLAFCWKQLR
jgi:hypothetical protein